MAHTFSSFCVRPACCVVRYSNNFGFPSQIWKDARIWKGFVKCCGRTTPQSLDIVLQLPLTERASAFVIEPALRDRLVVHLKKMTPQQRSTVQANVFEQLDVSAETGLRVKAN